MGYGTATASNGTAVVVVPEPSAALLLCAGSLLVGLCRRRFGER